MAEETTTGVAMCERYAVADVDSHMIEPPDLWTSRVSSRWGDLVPHVKFHERRGEDWWYVGSRKLYGVGAFAQAGWPEFPPSHPKNLEEALPAAVDPHERLAYMDKVGVYYSGAVSQHPGLPQPRVPERDGLMSWRPSASGPTTTG